MTDISAEQLLEQLVELQVQLAFQEDTVQALNDVVTRQQGEIDTLRLRCDQLEKRLDERLTALEMSQDEAPPPHY